MLFSKKVANGIRGLKCVEFSSDRAGLKTPFSKLKIESAMGIFS
jgi:hypothetical protein